MAAVGRVFAETNPIGDRMRVLLCLLLIMASFWKLEANSHHQFAQIIDTQLKSCPTSFTSEQKAQFLRSNIAVIAKEVLAQDIPLSAYQPRKDCQPPKLSMKAYCIWEGAEQGIPLTFFIYVWPTEKVALAMNPSWHGYGSIIHSHPIPCALAVLKGSLCQETYVQLPDCGEKVARYIREELLCEGDSEVDELDTGFIHRIVCRDEQGHPALSLHAYGLSTESDVWECFTQTYHQCNYALHDGARSTSAPY